MDKLENDKAPTIEKPSYSLWQLILYFLRLGTIGFGGPIALIGYMFRDLVEQRKWIQELDYKEGVTRNMDRLEIICLLIADYYHIIQKNFL